MSMLVRCPFDSALTAWQPVDEFDDFSEVEDGEYVTVETRQAKKERRRQNAQENSKSVEPTSPQVPCCTRPCRVRVSSPAGLVH